MLLKGISTGNKVADGFTAILGILDDIQGMYTTHKFSCTYPKDPQIFDKLVQDGTWKYIVSYNGALSRYARIFSSGYVRDITLKSTIDYIGLIDKMKLFLNYMG